MVARPSSVSSIVRVVSNRLNTLEPSCGSLPRPSPLCRRPHSSPSSSARKRKHAVLQTTSAMQWVYWRGTQVLLQWLFHIPESSQSSARGGGGGELVLLDAAAGNPVWTGDSVGGEITVESCGWQSCISGSLHFKLNLIEVLEI